MDAKFPEANHKSYLLAMRKLAAEGSAVQKGKSSARFTLERKFKDRALKRMN